MSAFAALSAAVAPAASSLPVGLNAKVEVIVSVDWYDLMGFLATAYGKPDLHVDPLESANDTTHEIDASSFSEFDLKWTIGRDREKHIAALLSGGVESPRGVVCVAVHEGKLPAAKYMVRVSW